MELWRLLKLLRLVLLIQLRRLDSGIVMVEQEAVLSLSDSSRFVVAIMEEEEHVFESSPFSSLSEQSMESKTSTGFGPSSSPLLSLSTFVHQHCSRLGAELTNRFDEAKRLNSKIAADFIQQPLPAAIGRSRSLPLHSYHLSLPFASVSQRQEKVAKNTSLSSDYVAKTLTGTSIYTVSNSNNEFVLISDPNSAKSIGLLCFRQEDAEAFLAQVRLRKGEVRGGAKVVPLTLDQ